MQIHHKSPIRDRPNLVPIVCTCEAEQQPITQLNSKLALWNCRSIISKASCICDAVLSEKLDILVLTETWLNGDTRDKPVIADITNNLPDHNFIHVPRYGRGGGVGVVLRQGYDVKQFTDNKFNSFENLDLSISSGSTNLRPTSKKHRVTTSTFLDDLSRYIETLTISPGHLLLAGDFNFHVDVPDDSDASSFLDFLDSTSLKQHVTTTTHKQGHILDLLITKSSDNFISSTKVTFDLPSDHAMVTCNLAVPRPKPTKILVNHRKLRSVNIKDLQHDIRSSLPPTKLPENIDEQVNLYNTTLQGLLDSHAPKRTRFVTLRPHAPWFDDGLRTAKQEKRRCERRWRKSGLEVHRQIYQQQCAVYWNLLENAKRAYHRATVEGCDDRDLFCVVNKFVNGKKPTILPSMDDNALRDAFLRFF